MDTLGDALRQITSALNQLGIRYAIGGSLASSARSIWRSTLDIDVVAAILPQQAEAFMKALGKDWYADPDTVQRAIAAGRSFNVIQMRAVQKVDVFPATGEFHRTQLERATVLRLGEDKVPCAVTTAEDILLAKLRRYAVEAKSPTVNGTISWACSRPTKISTILTWNHAARLGVSALLERARSDAAKE